MKKHLLGVSLVLVLLFGLCLPASAADFPDVPAGHWAASAIQEAAAQGIVSGYADGSFRPDEAVTIGQFCAYVSRAFVQDKLEEFLSDPYDTLQELIAEYGWHYPYISVLFMNGYLMDTSYREGGSDEIQAHADEPITRYDMAQILYNVMNKLGGPPADARREAPAGVADWSAVPETYREAVAVCYTSGILTGMDDGSFSGGASMTRAQGCVVLQRLKAAMGRHVLANGEPITEENVLALLDELEAKYPDGTLYMPLDEWYKSDATGSVSPGSQQSGCNGWACMASDYIFGQFSNNKPRALEDPTQSRPGDILELHNEQGRMRHVVVLTSRIMPSEKGGLGCWDTTYASGGENKAWWSDTHYLTENNDDYTARLRGRDYIIWTRYPD